MTPHLSHRPPARRAGPELLVLARWEEFAGWLLSHTARWPRSVRFTLCRRVQDHALDIAELLSTARYEPRERQATLRRVNLGLERMRLLLRLARGTGAMPARGFETALRGLNETGRMVHGWRTTLRTTGAPEPKK